MQFLSLNIQKYYINLICYNNRLDCDFCWNRINPFEIRVGNVDDTSDPKANPACLNQVYNFVSVGLPNLQYPLLKIAILVHSGMRNKGLSSVCVREVCLQFLSNPPPQIAQKNLDVQCKETGRYVTLHLPGPQKTLSVCEITVKTTGTPIPRPLHNLKHSHRKYFLFYLSIALIVQHLHLFLFQIFLQLPRVNKLYPQ